MQLVVVPWGQQEARHCSWRRRGDSEAARRTRISTHDSDVELEEGVPRAPQESSGGRRSWWSKEWGSGWARHDGGGDDKAWSHGWGGWTAWDDHEQGGWGWNHSQPRWKGPEEPDWGDQEQGGWGWNCYQPCWTRSKEPDLEHCLTKRDPEVAKLSWEPGRGKPEVLDEWTQLVSVQLASWHPSAARHWERAVEEASEAYGEYLTLGPHERHRIQPGGGGEL